MSMLAIGVDSGDNRRRDCWRPGGEARRMRAKCCVAGVTEAGGQMRTISSSLRCARLLGAAVA